MKHRIKTLLTFTSFLAACGSQATPEYRGEPLFHLSGQIAALSSGAAIPAADVALLWNPPEDGQLPQGTLATEGTVSGDFSSFAIDLYQPPPSDVLNASFVAGDDPAAVGASGYVIAVKAGSSLSQAAFTADDPILIGAVQEVLVAWVDRPLLATKLAGWNIAPTQLSAGYHLLHVHQIPEAPSQELIDACLSTFEGTELQAGDEDPQVRCREPVLVPAAEVMASDAALTMQFN